MSFRAIWDILFFCIYQTNVNVFVFECFDHCFRPLSTMVFVIFVPSILHTHPSRLLEIIDT